MEGIDTGNSCEYLKALCKSQRSVIDSLLRELESFKEEVRHYRITLGVLGEVSMKAEEIRARREYGFDGI